MKRYLAGRRVVDVQGPSGSAMSAARSFKSIPRSALAAYVREKQSRDAASGHIRGYSDAIATLNQLRLVGVNGPYSVVLSADAYASLSETSETLTFLVLTAEASVLLTAPRS